MQILVHPIVLKRPEAGGESHRPVRKCQKEMGRRCAKGPRETARKVVDSTANIVSKYRARKGKNAFRLNFFSNKDLKFCLPRPKLADAIACANFTGQTCNNVRSHRSHDCLKLQMICDDNKPRGKTYAEIIYS
jgi:hypothetical protein